MLKSYILKLFAFLTLMYVTGYLYAPLVIEIKEKLSFKESMAMRTKEWKKSSDVYCEKQRPPPKFLKTPSILDSSCNDDLCLYSKRIDWNMVIFVKSSVRNFALRELIRNTWGSISFASGAQFQTVFVVGKTEKQKQALVDEEHDRYDDILQVDLPDVFRNVNHKALAAMFWAYKHLPFNYFFAEADDDIVVNPFLTQLNIQEFKQASENQYWPEFPMVCMNGRVAYDAPGRKESDKHYVSTEEYKWIFWPDYCLGGMYVTSVKVAGELWKASRTGRMFDKTDVYITGILRQKIGLSRQMLLEARPNPVTPHHGFVSERPNQSMQLIKHNWDKIYREVKEKNICLCWKGSNVTNARKLAIA